MDGELVRRIMEEMQGNARKRWAIPAPVAKTRLRKAHAAWMEEWVGGWDLAACLHVPNSMRAAQAGWGWEWLQRHVAIYFKTVDACVFNTRNGKDVSSVKRFIVYEHADGVGWHAHILLATPDHISRDDYVLLLRNKWQRRVQRFCDGIFDEHLFYCEPVRGRYMDYCLKHAIETEDRSTAQKKAVIDYDNSSRW